MSPSRKPKPGQISALDKMRARTNYRAKRPTGYAPLFDAALADAARLADGAAFKLLMFIWSRSLGRRVEQNSPFMEITEPLAVSELAELARCDTRTAERELNGLAFRKVIARTKVKHGLFEFQPLFRSWASLPDYKAGPIPEAELGSNDEFLPEDLAKNATTTQVTAKPVYVAAGKKSKPLKVECGVKELQFSGDIDAAWSAVVQGGTLLVSLEQKWKAKDGVTVPNEINKLTSNPRQIRRISPEQSRGKRTKGERRTTSEEFTGSSVQHSRAEELSNLFDPFLLKSCGKSLSGDHVALLAACEAIQDVPHDFLVKVVVDRAARPISGPRAAVAICGEVYHNWQRSKDLPVQKKIPTHEELQAMVREDREKRLAAQKKGRVA